MPGKSRLQNLESAFCFTGLHGKSVHGPQRCHERFVAVARLIRAPDEVKWYVPKCFHVAHLMQNGPAYGFQCRFHSLLHFKEPWEKLSVTPMKPFSHEGRPGISQPFKSFSLLQPPAKKLLDRLARLGNGGPNRCNLPFQYLFADLLVAELVAPLLVIGRPHQEGSGNQGLYRC